MEPDRAVQRGLRLLARPDVAALQHRLDPAIEALDHAVGPGRCGRGEAVNALPSPVSLGHVARPRLGTNRRSPLCSNRWRNNGSLSSLRSADGSACPCPVPDLPQYRSCHEKGRSPRGNGIIRDGTATPLDADARNSLII
jgi:hypothetical protein